jgi:hypothetical protein
VGGFTSVFHTIQNAYGWSDKKILKLRIKRLVQIVHVLEHSREVEDMVRRLEIEWQTKVLASFLSNLAQDEKQATQMHAAVEKLSMLPPEAQAALADTSGEHRSLEDIMENGNVAAALAHNIARKGPALPIS